MLEEKIQRTKALLDEREKIDTELAALFGVTDKPRRGRPPKQKDPAEAGSEQSKLNDA